MLEIFHVEQSDESLDIAKRHSFCYIKEQNEAFEYSCASFCMKSRKTS